MWSKRTAVLVCVLLMSGCLRRYTVSTNELDRARAEAEETGEAVYIAADRAGETVFVDVRKTKDGTLDLGGGRTDAVFREYRLALPLLGLASGVLGGVLLWLGLGPDSPLDAAGFGERLVTINIGAALAAGSIPLILVGLIADPRGGSPSPGYSAEPPVGLSVKGRF